MLKKSVVSEKYLRFAAKTTSAEAPPPRRHCHRPERRPRDDIATDAIAARVGAMDVSWSEA
jgi:hypothetical protein